MRSTNLYILIRVSYRLANLVINFTGLSARSTQTCENSTLYITLSPCKECSKLIHQSGIKRVVFQHGYRDTTGLEFLEKAGVVVNQIEDLG